MNPNVEELCLQGVLPCLVEALLVAFHDNVSALGCFIVVQACNYS